MVILPTCIFTSLHLYLTSNQLYISLDKLKKRGIIGLNLQFFIDKFRIKNEQYMPRYINQTGISS